MNIVEYGLLVSVALCVLLIALFRFESKRGIRVGENIRRRFDFFVLNSAHRAHLWTQLVLKRVVKNSMHFTFHSVLKWLLGTLRAIENRIGTMMRVNITRAKQSEVEHTERNKLEEIALHKLSVALTEKEKKQHREKALNGE